MQSLPLNSLEIDQDNLNSPNKLLKNEQDLSI